MKGNNIGEFEELVLLTVASLIGDAYSVQITDDLTSYTGRNIKLGMVHSVLNRLEEKGYLISELGEPSGKRGGKRKRFYTPTDAGYSMIREIKAMRDQIYNNIPAFVWDNKLSWNF